MATPEDHVKAVEILKMLDDSGLSYDNQLKVLQLARQKIELTKKQ